MTEERETRGTEKIERIQKRISKFLLSNNVLYRENRIKTERVVENIYYIDIYMLDLDIVTVENLIMHLQTYSSLRTYEMRVGTPILRMIFDFNGVLQ